MSGKERGEEAEKMEEEEFERLGEGGWRIEWWCFWIGWKIVDALGDAEEGEARRSGGMRMRAKKAKEVGSIVG